MSKRSDELFEVALKDLPADDEFVKHSLDRLHGGGSELALESLLTCVDNMETHSKF